MTKFFYLKVTLERKMTPIKKEKKLSDEDKIKRQITHHKLGLKGKIKTNKTFLKELRRKIKNKNQIEKK